MFATCSPLRRLMTALVALSVVGAVIFPATPAHSAPAEPQFNPEKCLPYNPSPLPGNQAWQVERLRYPELHKLATGRGVKVAVLDTGVGTPGMPHLAGVNIVPIDKIGNRGLSSDGQFDCDHGSIVTSLLVAQPGKTPGPPYSGIAPGVEVYSYRALATTRPPANQPTQPLVPVLQSIEDAITRKVDIISISQQSGGTRAYRLAIKKAVDAGILVVAAAGNDGPSGPTYPAAYDGVMAVAMTDLADQADERSQWGGNMKISVAAPGVAVVANLPTCKMGSKGCEAEDKSATTFVQGPQSTGTSFATPIVAGAAALVMQRFPEMTAQQVKERLEETADPPPGGGVDPQLGHGVINPYRALTAPTTVIGSTVPVSPPTAPVPAPPGPPDTTLRDRTLLLAGATLALVAVAAAITAALPWGRRRRWRAAR